VRLVAVGGVGGRGGPGVQVPGAGRAVGAGIAGNGFHVTGRGAGLVDQRPEHLVLECHKHHNGHYDIYGRMWWDRVAPTLTSGCTNVTRGRFAHPVQNRAITLREAMLLQTFPPRARLYGGVEKMALQVGNAVPSLLAQRIGETITAMDRATMLQRQD